MLGGVFGALLYAAGINLFVVPAELYTGGLMGICQVSKYTVAVFRRTRRGHQISLRVVVSHHVVAGI